MADYSLIPVDHQPDFGGVSLVPVEHDPFGVDGAAQPPSPATNLGQANVAAADGALDAEAGESWNPDNVNADIPRPSPSTGSVSSPNTVPFKPFGELKPATFTSTQRIGNLVADGVTALGMQPYTANDLTKRIGNVLGLIPQVAVAGSALDLIDAKRRGDLPGAIAAAAGLIPGAKGVARSVAEGVRSGRALVGDALGTAESPAILSEEVAGRTRSQIRDLAAAKGLVPKGDPLRADYPRRWNDPVTNQPRLRLDRGHVDMTTGQPFDIPNAAVDHVHAYDINGNPVEVNGDRHIPTAGE